MKFSLLVIVAIAVSLIACDNIDDAAFSQKGVDKSMWLEIDPPPNMPDGTTCYVWFSRSASGKALGQVPMCNVP